MIFLPVRVVFVDPSLVESLRKLEEGTFEEKRLAKWIRHAIDCVSLDPQYGTKVPSKVWPKEYVQEYKITNLWKVDFPMGWRMMYTLRNEELDILSIILEWFNHPHYERRHGY